MFFIIIFVFLNVDACYICYISTGMCNNTVVNPARAHLSKWILLVSWLLLVEFFFSRLFLGFMVAVKGGNMRKIREFVSKKPKEWKSVVDEVCVCHWRRQHRDCIAEVIHVLF